MVRLRDVFITCIVAVHVVLGIPPAERRPYPSECRSLMDLYFVIDSSDSISIENFEKLKHAIVNFIYNDIDIGPSRARIGMLVYSSDVPYTSMYPFIDNKDHLMDAAFSLEHLRDGTNTSLGLQRMREMFGAYGRPGVPWVCVTITDGISKSPEATIAEAMLADKMGISMFSVGIGNRVNLKELRDIASTEQQVIQIKNFNQLARKLSSMMTKICPCPIPPVLELAKCNDGPRAISTVRSYQCMEGYLQRGNPNITCMDDFTWTPLSLDFECVPCGTTPVIEHGHCVKGLSTIGTVRELACDAGYLPSGKATITCGPDAAWSKTGFTCKSCGKTQDIEHSSCGGGVDTIGATRVYTCHNGYLLQGNPKITCGPDAVWSKTGFTCKSCGKTPDIEHSSCGGGVDTIGATREYACHNGYLLQGNPEITCGPDAAWSKTGFTCKSCGKTPDIEHSSCGGGVDTIGATREYACHNGYLLQGNPKITCGPDAAWSKTGFTCKSCGKTPDIEHSSCGGGVDTIGAIREYACHNGYLLQGNPKITCGPDAAWSKTGFTCKSCGKTPDIEHSSCGGGVDTIGATREYACHNGYLLQGNPEITCGPDAAWSKTGFTCKSCGKTPDIEHSSCGGGVDTIGATREYACHNGYLLQGNPEITCGPDAAWSKTGFTCKSCGKTPDIEHSSCGGGVDTIGANREYTCHNGYLLQGNPEITCGPDAAWSKTGFTCKSCGKTPDIEHSSCGGGVDTIGATREYACHNGYLLQGNPEITCGPDAAWSKTGFTCKSCGAPPKVDFGFCYGDSDTIGTKRQFSCQTGYFGVGQAEVECLPSAQWSTVDYTCSPCKDTPAVPHATCGGGDSIIGSERKYSCSEGYLAVGDLTIKCLPNATWSAPSFTCNDCGPTPDVDFAYCGLGPSTINAERVYQCESGYEMRGRGKVKCLQNGKWQKPNFSCYVKSTTTPRPLRIGKDPSVCDGCRFINGVGFNNHPFDCNQYVQCTRGRSSLMPVYRKCPFGQFWDQKHLTCDLSKNVHCPNDKCADKSVRGYKPSNSEDCCSYWKCKDGKSHGECCGKSFSYSSKHGRCMPNAKCEYECEYEQEIPGCDLRPAPDGINFQQHIGKGIWRNMSCPLRTKFNTLTCVCSDTIETTDNVEQVCTPELHMPFTDSLGDSRLGVWSENVQLYNGTAFFDGRFSSRLVINRYSNTAFHGDFVVSFKYKEIIESPDDFGLQALVSNGDCGDDPSIIIAKMPGYVLMGARTDKSKSMAVPTLNTEWKEVIYIHNQKKLEGRVSGATKGIWSWGPIQSTHCGLQIGHGTGLRNFNGYIDDLKVYHCRPANI